MVQPSTKGVLYYWAIALGLFAGPALAVVFAYYDIDAFDNTWISAGLLTLLIAAFSAYLVVALEIWQEFGFLAAIAAFLVFPVCVIYWLSRISGLETTRSDND